MAVFVESHDLNRNVASSGVLLELAQDRPTEHVRQENVERYGAWVMRARQGERIGAAMRDQHLESFVFRQLDHDPRVMRIVFDNQYDAVVWLDIVAVIDDQLRRPFHEPLLRRVRRRGRSLAALRCRLRGGAAYVGQRQEQRKGAALPRDAAQLDFTAQEIRQLAADRQSQAGAAVLAAGARVGLLEGFENDALLFRRDAYP